MLNPDNATSSRKPLLLGISLLVLCGLGGLVAVALLVGTEHQRSRFVGVAGVSAAAAPAAAPVATGQTSSPIVQATWARHYFCRRPACRRAAMGLCPNMAAGPGVGAGPGHVAAAMVPPGCATCPNAGAGATPAAATLPPGCATCPNAANCLPPPSPTTPAALGVALVPWAAKNPFVTLEPPLNTANNCATCPQRF